MTREHRKVFAPIDTFRNVFNEVLLISKSKFKAAAGAAGFRSTENTKYNRCVCGGVIEPPSAE